MISRKQSGVMPLLHYHKCDWRKVALLQRGTSLVTECMRTFNNCISMKNRNSTAKSAARFNYSQLIHFSLDQCRGHHRNYTREVIEEGPTVTINVLIENRMDRPGFGSYFNDIISCKEDVKYPINPRWRIWKLFSWYQNHWVKKI